MSPSPSRSIGRFMRVLVIFCGQKNSKSGKFRYQKSQALEKPGNFITDRTLYVFVANNYIYFDMYIISNFKIYLICYSISKLGVNQVQINAVHMFSFQIHWRRRYYLCLCRHIFLGTYVLSQFPLAAAWNIGSALDKS